jgi:hypothetical protein
MRAEDLNPAGVVVVNLGGTGGTVANHLWDAFGQGAELESNGVQLLYLDGIADDPRVRVGPAGVGLDTGPASVSFVLSNEDPTALLGRIAASPVPLTEWPAVTPAEADIERRSPLPPGVGLGGNRLRSAMSATLSRSKLVRRIHDLVRTARTQAAGGRNPTVIVVASGAGGFGSGHLIPVITGIRADIGRDFNLWVVLVSADPYEHNLEPLERGDMWARAIATQRELDLLAPGTIDYCYIVGGGPPSYQSAPAGSGVLSSVAVGLETMIRQHAIIEANVPNWTFAFFNDARRTERHSVFGAATVWFPAIKWAALTAHQIAAEAWEALTYLGTDARQKAAADARNTAEGLPPSARAARMESIPARDEPPVATGQEAAVEDLLEGLTPDPTSLRPPVGVVLDRGGGRFARLRADDQVARCTAEVDTATKEVADYVVEARKKASRALRERLRDTLLELQGTEGSRVLGPDPGAVARVSHQLTELERLHTVAAERLETAVAAVVATGDPVEKAQARVNEAGAALPPLFGARSHEWADYCDAVEELARARRWRMTTGGAVDTWRHFAGMVVAAARPVADFVALAVANASEAGRLAAEVEQTLGELHARPSTRVVPAPGSPAANAVKEQARQSLGDNAARWILDQVRCEPRCPAPSSEESWDLVLYTPEVPGYMPARTWSVLSASSASDREDAKDMTPGLFGAMAKQRLEPFCGAQSLMDVLGMEVAYNWAPDRGGVLDVPTVESYLASVLDELTGAAEPHLTVATDPIDGRQVRPPSTMVLDFADFRPAISRAGIQIEAAIQGRLHNAHPNGTLGRITRLTFVHRVSPSHLRVVQDHLADYHSSHQLIHTSSAARWACEMEKTATEVHNLPRRLLDPDVVALMADERAFLAAAKLLALDGLDRESLEPGGPLHFVARLDRAGHSELIDLGRDPAAAVAALLTGPHAAQIRPRLMTEWEDAWAKLVAHHGGEAGADEQWKLAARALTLPASPRLDVDDLLLVIRLLSLS